LALEEGVDVRLEAIKSLEGMYTPDGPLVVVGSLRPRGRRSYTCAHELGHHLFGHGVRVDELLADRAGAGPGDDAEYLANRFAAALLMPKLAVLYAFAARRWDVASCTPVQALTIAGFLGVGYTTLIDYLESTLTLIGAAVARELRVTSPKDVREEVAGSKASDGLVVVDESWDGRPVDAEVGDLVLVPAGTQVEAGPGVAGRVGDAAIRANAPGTARLRRGSWGAALRVMRTGYTGLATYRYLEEVSDDP
jgi:Zn-dependent peptidase ImmA (M78 family)